jgi:enoyl-CoA hydratase/carnithine racemase
MEERLTAAGGELAAVVRAGVASVTLNRPASLNALSFGMIEGLAAWLERWRGDDAVRTIVLRGAGTKAFCAGGDVREIHHGFKAGSRLPHDFFVAEYALDFAIHTYPKPIVAHMDGIVMGGGMGLAQGAALRIVGDRTRMAMPETALGLFPDVGGSWFLSRLEGGLGAYLGLAGPTLTAADAIHCGLADLDVGANPGARGEIEGLRPAIDEHFAHGSVEEIVRSLAGERRPEYAPWARRTAEGLARRSPTMLKVTLEQLRRGATMSLAECFRMELNLIERCFEQGDIIEGIRAVIVEKDNAPRWSPSALTQVDRASVERFFEPRWTPARHPLASLQQTARNP